MYPVCLRVRMDAALLLWGLDQLPQDVPAKRPEWKPISQCSELSRCSLKSYKESCLGRERTERSRQTEQAGGIPAEGTEDFELPGR